MRALLARLTLLTLGMAVLETALASAPGTPLSVWGALLAAGLASLLGGSVGFMLPALGQGRGKGSR